MVKKIIALVISFVLILAPLTTTVSAEYSITKPDKTYKDNAYIKGHDTAIIYVPGYRCTNLETRKDIDDDGDKEILVSFAVGSKVFEVSDKQPAVLNFVKGFANLLISGYMLLTSQLRDKEMTVSEDGGFGLADIYNSFFVNCVELYGDTCDVIIYDFDWRNPLEIPVNDLYEIIKFQNYKKVIMVTQSMGGLIASGTAKLLWNDKQDKDKTNDVEVYTVNVGSTVLGSFLYYLNKTSYKGIKKLTPGYITYQNELSFPSRAQLAAPTQTETLYGRKYATAKIEKNDGTVVYEDIDADLAFSDLKKICDNGDYLQNMQNFYNDYIFIDHDNNPDTDVVHIMEELGSNCYYIAGLASGTYTHIQINYTEDKNGKRTPINCEQVTTDNPSAGDGSLLIESATMNMCTPETTFYVPHAHQEVYFHDDSQHLMYDMIDHIVKTPEKKFDYTATGYKYTEVYTNPNQYKESESDNLLYPQIAVFVLEKLGIKVTFEEARNACHKIFSFFN